MDGNISIGDVFEEKVVDGRASIGDIFERKVADGRASIGNVFGRKVADGRASIHDLLQQGLSFFMSLISVSMLFICSTCRTLKRLCQDDEDVLFIRHLAENPQLFHLQWMGNLLLEWHPAWQILLLILPQALQW